MESPNRKSVTNERDPAQAAVFLPQQPGEDRAFVPHVDIPSRAGAGQELASELPTPPRELHVGYGDSSDHYLKTGEWDHTAILRNLQTTGFELGRGDRVLEFGCAAARILRNFRAHAEIAEVWGVDINATSVRWCQQNLSPPLRFCTTTTFPHLPFEDNHFSLIYAASIFTHIFDLDDMWLLELRRILRPGGRLYVTVHDEDTLKTVSDPAHWSAGMREQVRLAREAFPAIDRGFDVFTTNRLSHNQIVFHHSQHIRQKWSQFIRVLELFPSAHEYQTAVIMEKL